MVAMNRVMWGWFTRGRRTMRSVAMPNSTMAPKARIRASQKGAPISWKPTKVRAAKNTMAPWAKLKTPEAL